jgi:hypothetical protein
MKINTRKTLKSSIDEFKKESLISKYRIMVSYLNFLYRKHPQLELEIILMIFHGSESKYQSFISNKLNLEKATLYCHQLFLFLENRGYPCSFVEYKEKAQLK